MSRGTAALLKAKKRAAKWEERGGPLYPTGTRVWTAWRGGREGREETATVVRAPSGPGEKPWCTVRFDDGTVDEVAEAFLRPAEWLR